MYYTIFTIITKKLKKQRLTELDFKHVDVHDCMVIYNPFELMDEHDVVLVNKFHLDAILDQDLLPLIPT